MKFPAVRAELPQLFTTDTVGADGTGFGDDVPLAGVLTQPLAETWVSEYVCALFTVMDVEVAPVLHNTDSVKLPAVNTELPQLLATLTVGAVGIVFGADVAVPVWLTHPLAPVCVAV